jgi:hypothetical protein
MLYVDSTKKLGNKLQTLAFKLILSVRFGRGFRMHLVELQYEYDRVLLTGNLNTSICLFIVDELACCTFGCKTNGTLPSVWKMIVFTLDFYNNLQKQLLMCG